MVLKEPNGFRPETIEITVPKSTKTAVSKSTEIAVSEFTEIVDKKPKTADFLKNLQLLFQWILKPQILRILELLFLQILKLISVDFETAVFVILQL